MEAEVRTSEAEVFSSEIEGRPVRSGIIGTGFMGMVHSRAVHASGGQLVAVAGTDPYQVAASAAEFGAARVAASVEDLIGAPDIDVVHVCTPNHTHVELARAALEAGKNVICEKPLATTVEGALELVNVAADAGLVGAVPFLYRFYPMVREARARIREGQAGPLRVLHGAYLQDWLARPTDSDWRISAELGGSSRAFGDIGVHWVDLVEFTSGHRITSLCASTLIAHGHRGIPGEQSVVDTEDVAAVLFRTDLNAVGTLTVSQISQGRKNRFSLSLDGDAQSLAFDHELPEQLWVGETGATALISRGSAATSAEARRLDRVPAGHPQGYQDCANAFVADVYAATRGETPDGLPTFTDGLRATQVTAAVMESAASGRWETVG